MTTSKALKSGHADHTMKRKAPSETTAKSNKKRQINQTKSQPSTKDNQTTERHGDVIRELSPKFNVIPVNVISSSKIQQRVSSVKESLASSATDKPTVVLLHSRTKEVCKVITIVELCKRLCSKDQITLYQYNEMFELPDDQVKPSKREKIDQTVLAKGNDSDDDDDFEVMQQSRILDAVLPAPPARKTKSLRVFLSTQPVPELKAKSSVTLQLDG